MNKRIFALMFFLAFCFLPYTGFASSPEAWEAYLNTIKKTCKEKSGFLKPEIIGEPAETQFHAIAVVQGKYPQKRMEGEVGTFFCLYHQKTGEVEFVENTLVCRKRQSTCGLVTTQTDPLNIRAKPRKKAKVVGRASKDSALFILETVGSWHKVKLNDGTVGYGNRDFIRDDDGEFCSIVATKGSSLNIRAAASKNAKVVAKAHKGTALYILKGVGVWYQVKLNDGTIGYVNSNYVDDTHRWR